MITVNGVEMPWHPGLTIEEILSGLEDEVSIVVVKIDGKTIQRKQYSTFEVRDTASMITIDVIAGG